MYKFQYPPLDRDTLIAAQEKPYDKRLAEILKNNYDLHIRRSQTYEHEKDRLAERDLAQATAKAYLQLTGRPIDRGSFK